MYKLRDMQIADLSLVRGWRNSPEIKLYFFSQNEITAVEHEQWFRDKRAIPHHHLKVFEYDGLAIGFLQLFSQKSKNYEWGFYIAPTHLAQGYGKILINQALQFAFTQLDANKISGKVLEGNIASKKLHLSNGFKQEAPPKCPVQTGVNTTLYYGLLKTEWLNQQ